MTETKPKRQRKNTSAQNGYVGNAGHLAVMAELAWRGYNVAIPEIDKGDDIFAVDDRNGKLWRLQVKTAQFQEKNGYYQVAIEESQIHSDQDLHFIFALRVTHVLNGNPPDHWRFVIMSRSKLKEYIDGNNRFGNVAEKRRRLQIRFSKRTPGQLTCAYEDWTKYLEDWSTWPIIDYTIGMETSTCDQTRNDVHIFPTSDKKFAPSLNLVNSLRDESSLN